MARPQLTAEPRAVLGKQVAQLRRDGRLPGVVYGQGHESEAISLDLHEFELLHRRTGRHAVLDLNVAGARIAQPVLLQGIQEHPISRRPIHVDLLLVNLQEEMTVDVPVVAVGESVAIEKLGGVLLHLHDSVVVRAKPDDLPSSLELDISSLDSFEAVLHVSDLRVPEGVTLVTDPSEPIARVQQPRIEEAEAVVAPAEGEAPAAEGGAEEGAGESTEGSSES
ncbi:MAG TPA: 50S ribosomal protein L25 [Candidatus Limnocylindrales bacterium]